WRVGATCHDDEFICKTGWLELLAHPAGELIVADASDQSHLHPSFDRRERSVGARAADPDRHLFGQHRAARGWQIRDGTHHHIRLDAPDHSDGAAVWSVARVPVHSDHARVLMLRSRPGALMQGSCPMAGRTPILTWQTHSRIRKGT